MARPNAWYNLLNDFVKQVRIVSREQTAALGETGVKVAFWGSQRRIVRQIIEGMEHGLRKFYVLKSRQLGSSTAFVIIAIFWMALHPNLKGALVVDQDKTRDDFRETIRNIINSIPASYFGGAFGIKKGADNKYFMAFTNGSQLNFLVAGTSASKVKWGESTGYSFVLLSEIASYGSDEGLLSFEEAMSDTNPDRFYVYESTAKGMNHWHKRWKSARADPFTKCCIFVGWWSKELNSIKRIDPRFVVYGVTQADEYEQDKINKVKELYGHEITMEQLAWYRWRQSSDEQTEDSLNQNQPWTEFDAFVLSGKSYFAMRMIAKDMDRLDSPETSPGYQGFRFWLGSTFWDGKLEDLGADDLRRREIELRVWQPPHPDATYVIGCDPAGGSKDTNDRHAIEVWRCYADRLVQVAEYADNMVDTRRCAWVLAYLAGVYRNCMVIVELSGGYGRSVLVELEHIRDMLRAEHNSMMRAGTRKNIDWTDFLDNAVPYIYRKVDNPASAGYVLHFQTTGDNKRKIFSQFRDAHVNGYLEINSRDLLGEMQIIVQDKDEIGAPNNMKDDRTFASCLAAEAWVLHKRAPMLALGETYDVVRRREETGRPGTNIVDQIVTKVLTQINEPMQAPLSPAQAWLEERGLQ